MLSWKPFLLLLASTTPVLASTPQPLTWMRSAVFSPNGKRVATAGDEGILRLYDTATGNILKSVRTSSAKDMHVTQIAYSADGRMIATTGSDGKIRIWAAETLKPVRSWAAGTSYVSGIAWPRAGKYLATSGYDNAARLWDPLKGKQVRRLTGLESDAYAVAMSRDGKLVAAGGPDGTCRIWNAGDGKLVRTLTPGQVMSIAFSPNGKYIATDGKDFKYYLYELATGKLVLSQATDSGKAITGLAFSPDSSKLAIGDYANQAIVIDLTGELVNVFVGHTENVSSVEFSPDGKFLLTASFDSTAKLWDLASGECLRTFHR